ncbi:hypothetical protein B0T24DRAFT_172662 [Lasiosphaeria ovina]|uniref:Uncharacterized protein n=1 Tax=Lasiosphaeria ovina TaxID=92902 RepID=A0AAE0TT71_9PEZI|nr:hypothetical protein B0T24DRAFT_172662 [Lasiosphaeria ovina]
MEPKLLCSRFRGSAVPCRPYLPTCLRDLLTLGPVKSFSCQPCSGFALTLRSLLSNHKAAFCFVSFCLVFCFARAPPSSLSLPCRLLPTCYSRENRWFTGTHSHSISMRYRHSPRVVGFASRVTQRKASKNGQCPREPSFATGQIGRRVIPNQGAGLAEK